MNLLETTDALPDRTVEPRDPFLSKVLHTIHRFHMLVPEEKALVGVSGGADSVALLRALVALQPWLPSVLHVAHLHHGLRGQEADQDAAFVQDLAAALSLACTIERIPVAAEVLKRRLSLQEGARQIRYHFFEQVAHRTGCTRVVVGHTADDQVETLLMRLLQGTGPRGLAGIPPVRGPVVRPLVETTREEIMAYLTAQGYPHQEDSSNQKTIYLRNRLRHQVLPLLRSINPNVTMAMVRHAEIQRDEDRLLDDDAEGLLSDLLLQEENGRLSLDVHRMRSLPKPLQRRVIRLAAARVLGGVPRISYEQCEAVCSHLVGGAGLAHKTGQITTLVSGLRAMLFPDRLEFDVRVVPTQEETGPFDHEIGVPGRTVVDPPGLCVVARIVDQSEVVPGFPPRALNDSCVGRFDLDRFTGPLRIRNRRAGDWFCPSGMGGRRQKVKQYFIDHKVPRAQRGCTPILESPEGILWIVGWRLDERFAAAEHSRALLEVTISR